MVNKRGQIYERNVRHAYLFLRRHFGSRSTVIPSPRGQDLSFSRWQRCYKSRGSFPVYLAAVVQKRSNAPVLGQKLATKVSKSRAIPPYVPGVTPPGWPLIGALKRRLKCRGLKLNGKRDELLKRVSNGVKNGNHTHGSS